ncbi:MAG: hypothetical protein M1828_004831 [Chrysothrix sp. TS-e1954]|nr:MAG: hypothetical protein M1828_004831 [Chrysothrix sp. TS-e1954]
MAMVGAAGGMPLSMKNDMNPMGGAPIKDPRDDLPTYIYDFFLKSGKLDLASAILKSDLGVKVKPRGKTSPGSVNGVDDSMDSKDNKMPNADLPATQLLESSFLQEWWTIFWDFWAVGKGQMKQNPMASQYVNRQQLQQRQQKLLMRNNMLQMNPNMRGMMQNGTGNGMNPMNGEGLRRGAVQKHMMNMQGVRNMQDQQRDDSDMDMNGQGRPQSPGSSDNARSPKRQRVDGPFGGQAMGPGGRPNSMAPHMNGFPPNGMMQNGLDANSFTNPQFNGMSGPGFPRLNANNINAVQMSEAAMAKMGVNGMQQRGAMMGQGPDGFDIPMGLPNGANAAGALQRGMNGNNPNQQGGALADYQMQLMLLEQQNKKRLLMARQEQEGLAQSGGIPAAGNQVMMNQGMFAPGMSPRGSRNGHSPGSNEQMRRGTPGGGQGSPRPDGSIPATRGSPAPGFDPNQMPPNYQQMAQMKSLSENMMNGQNGPMMRPPSFNGQVNPQMQEFMRQRAAMQGHGGPMGGPGQPGSGNPGPIQSEATQRNPMPPPQAPGNTTNGRTQPSSPQQNPAPPTPGQGTKGNAKQKKETKEKKKPAKKNATTTGATPSSEAEQPPTPTPPTPITPVAHNNPFGSKAGPGQPPQQQGGPQQDAGQQETTAPFGDGGDLANFDPLSFAGMTDNSDVLEGFDFDSLLNMDQTIGPGFDNDPSQFPFDGVEMTGES